MVVMVTDDGWGTIRVSSVVEAEGKVKCNKEERKKGSKKVGEEEGRKKKRGEKSGSGVGKETKKGIFLNISVVRHHPRRKGYFSLDKEDRQRNKKGKRESE